MNYNLSLNDFNVICRVCLVKQENMTSVDTDQISYMLNECASAQESIRKKLPQQICSNCFWKLKLAYEFKQQCVLALEILSTTLKREESANTRQKTETTEENKSTTDLKLTKLEPDILIKTEEENSDAFLEQFGINSDDFSYNDEESKTENTDETSLEKENSEAEKKEKINNANLLESNRQKSLADFLRKKYNIYDLTCNVCNKELSTRATLVRHMETHDKGRVLNFCCKICNKWFYTAENLKKHQMRHMEKAKYQCSQCPKRFFVLSALGCHNKTVHKAKPIQCTKCTSKFYHQLQLEQHESSHEKKEYTCDVCGKVFTLRYYLREHQITHSEDRQFTCNQCDKGFKHKATLQAHIKLQHIDPERREVCNICGKLILPSTLRSHLKTHDKKTVYPCPDCKRIYNTKHAMRVHVKEKHSGASVIKYHCEICNKALCSKGTLATHMRITHTDDPKKVKCHICGKAYKLVSHVNAHIKSAHMDIRPHTCQTCSKAFHNKFELKNHMRSHTGERPFPCDVCGKAFGFKAVLKTHMKVHMK